MTKQLAQRDGTFEHASKRALGRANRESTRLLGHAREERSSRAELRARGKSLRDAVPREAHARWQPADERADPLLLLEASSRGRMPELIPLRYGRMLQSPFTFYRGAALNMAADLAHTPSSGMRVQACGDCHLLNFGGFATPERRVVFDINDLDETLPAPWEWDVKRLACSFVLACRDRGFSESCARDAALDCAHSYRKHMDEFSEMSRLEAWYASIDESMAIATFKDARQGKRIEARVEKAEHRKPIAHEFPELVTVERGVPTIREHPPLIFHPPEERQGKAFAQLVSVAFAAYRESLPDYRRVLLDRFELMDIAVKVVGVGSVGTFCAIVLLMASERDPLFLQIKQAGPSVLEAYAGKSAHSNHGQRVVVGCHLMQSASDIFLGWTQGLERQFYVRQLKDMKIKPLLDSYTPSVMSDYAKLCGWALARAHSRTGEPAQLSGYMGKKSEQFDQAVATFSVDYADQSERDHAVLIKAVRNGKLPVVYDA